jgi:hypothetical protein
MCSQAAKVPWLNSEAAAEALRALASTDGDLSRQSLGWARLARSDVDQLFCMGLACRRVGVYARCVLLSFVGPCVV